MTDQVKFRKFHAGQKKIASELQRLTVLRMGRRFR